MLTACFGLAVVLGVHVVDDRRPSEPARLSAGTRAALPQAYLQPASFIPAVEGDQTVPNAGTPNMIKGLLAVAEKLDALETDMQALRSELAVLNESMVAVGDALSGRIKALEAAREAEPAETASPPPAGGAGPADIAALTAYLRVMGDRVAPLEALSEEPRQNGRDAANPLSISPPISEIEAVAAAVGTLEERVASLSSAMEERDAAFQAQQKRLQVLEAATVDQRQRSADQQNADQQNYVKVARIDGFEEASMAALETLDRQFQAVLTQFDEAAARDEELAASLDSTRVALETELAEWRDRQIPPVWEFTGRLAGTEVRFSQGTVFSDPAAAETAMQHATELLLEADSALGLRVVGYADFDGTDAEANRTMSQKRADRVRDQMIGMGVPDSRLVSVGRSTEDRVVDSDAFGNANRRVRFEPFVIEMPGS